MNRPLSELPLVGPVRGIALGGLLLASAQAPAALIPTELTISATLDYDTGFAWAVGGARFSGSMDRTVGGVSDAVAFSETIGPGTNPVAAVFTDIDDGVGVSGTASAANTGDVSELQVGIDVTLSLANASTTETFEVVFDIAFSNVVDADGADAYAESELFLRNNASGDEPFVTFVVSDTFNGNQASDANGNVVDLPGFGGPVSQSGPSRLTLTLAPGDSIVLNSLTNQGWTLRGGAFGSGDSAGAGVSAFVRIARVTGDGPSLPAPSVLPLLAIGGLGLVVGRRRR